MDYLQAIILGVVQGITEWLPISSSGHLVVFQKLFGINPPVFFDILLHVGSLLAVLIYFRKDILAITRKNFAYIIVATGVTGVIALIIKEPIKALFSNTSLVGVAFIATGLLLLATKFFKGREDLQIKHPILLGIAQAAAILPGISRSGATISAGIISGADKEKIAKFSFLMSIPAIIGATIIEWEIGAVDLLPTILGISAAFVSGYLSIDLLMKLIRKNGFWKFSIYLFLIGAITLLL
jgi:undecaprenyl-diphosphatase